MLELSARAASGLRPAEFLAGFKLAGGAARSGRCLKFSGSRAARWDGCSPGAVFDAALAGRGRATAARGAGARRSQDLAYGTLRFLGHLEALLDELLERPLRDARLRALLAHALYQLVHTRAAHHAIVDHAVQCAARLGLSSAKGLVNGPAQLSALPGAADGARAAPETARYSPAVVDRPAEGRVSRRYKTCWKPRTCIRRSLCA